MNNRKVDNIMVSVIIPTYNRKEQLIRAIRSVLNQSYRDFEIIVVDDNSDFNVENFIKDKINYPIKILRNEKNIGPSESRNIGVINAKGRFVAFLDSDDYWDEKKLEEQVKVFKKNPNIELVYCDQKVIEKNGREKKSSKNIINDNLWENLLNWWTAPNTSTLMFDKNAFLKIGGFDPSLVNCEDHDLWMRVAKNNIKVLGIKKPLSFFNMACGENRLSLHFTRRFIGMENFLSKWEDEIIKSKGKRHYRWFSNKYKNNAAFPIFMFLVRKGKMIKATKILCKYLIFNSCFYKYIYLKSLIKFKKYFFY